MEDNGIVIGDGSGGVLLPDLDTKTTEENFEEKIGDLLALMVFSDLILEDNAENA